MKSARHGYNSGGGGGRAGEGGGGAVVAAIIRARVRWFPRVQTNVGSVILLIAAGHFPRTLMSYVLSSTFPNHF